MDLQITLFIFQCICLLYSVGICSGKEVKEFKEPAPGEHFLNMEFLNDRNIYRNGTPPPWSPLNLRIGESFVAKHEGRIVGGVDAEPHQIPYQVGIDERPHPNVICGGSIIAKTWILTAAHCFFGPDRLEVPKSHFIMIGGGHNLAKPEKTEQRRKVKQYILHPNYKNDKRDDVALVEIEEPFKLSEAVKIIKTANLNSKYDETCTVSGWGWTQPKPRPPNGLIGPQYPDTLKVVNLHIIEKELCKKLHASTAPVYAAYDKIICAGVLGIIPIFNSNASDNANKYNQALYVISIAGGKDACQSDSGGPLICKDDKGEDLLVGAVASGYGCAQKDFPGFYSEVAKFQDFILKHVPELKKPEPPKPKPVQIHHHTNCTCTCPSQ